MKKIISAFGAIVILLTQTAFAQNQSIVSCDFSQLSDDWTVSCTDNTNSEVKVEDEAVVLSFDTTASAGKARSELMSPTFSLTGRYINIEFGMFFSGNNEKNIKKLTLKDDNIFNALDIISVSKGKMEVDGNEVADVEEDVYYTINIAIDKETDNAIIYLDNNVLFEGELGISNLNTESLYFDFRNYLSSSTTAVSVWSIDYFECQSGGSVEYSTTADNQTIFKESDMAEFVINYNGFIHPEMFLTDSYTLYKDSEPVEFAVEKGDSSIIVTPTEGFVAGCVYEIAMNSSKDIFGDATDELVDVTFHIVSDSYDESQNYIDIELKSGSEIVEGQTASVAVDAQMQEGINCLEIYINGSLYRTILKDSAVCQLSLAEGVHEIYAVVVSKTGARQSSETVTVTVSGNTAPSVSFAGYSDSAYFSMNGNCMLTINAEDSDGIDRVEIYKDDVLAQTLDTPPYSFDASVLGLGNFELRAVAYDIYGKSAEKSLSVNISSNFESVIFADSDFEATSDTSFKSGLNYSNQRGFCKPGTVDDAHGASLLMGVNEHNSEFTDGQYSYCQYPVGDNKNIVLEYDVNILEKPKSGAKNCVNMGIRYTNATTVTFMNIQNVFSSAGKDYVYELNTWYNIKFEINQTQGKYRIYINDELFVESNYDAATYGDMQQFRFYSPVLNDQPCTVALDNIELKAIMYAPTIESVGYGDYKAPDTVDNAAQSVVVYLSDELKAADISPETVKLYNSAGSECDITVAYNETDYTITITPTDGFESNEQYTVVIDKSVRIPSGEIIGGDIRAEFKTSSDNISVDNVEISASNGNVYAEITVTNPAQQDTDFYVIASIFDGETLEKSMANKYSVSGSVQEEISAEYSDMMGKTMELYIFDSLSKPLMMADTIFTFGE